MSNAEGVSRKANEGNAKHPALLPFSLNSMKLMELIEFHSTSINGRRGDCRNCERKRTVKGNARRHKGGAAGITSRAENGFNEIN